MTGTSQAYMDYQEENNQNFGEAYADNVLGQKFPGKFGLSFCLAHNNYFKDFCFECHPTEPRDTKELMDDNENFDLLEEYKKQ